MAESKLLPDDYPALLNELKQRIRESQLRASVSVNRELVLLYWRIGREILVRQQREHWGTKVIDRLAADLKKAFPEMKDFSPRNLKYMRAFADAWPEEGFVQQVAAQIPWFHNCVLLDKLDREEDRIWYAKASIQHGWSRTVLVHQIETALHRRSGAAVTNFERTLPLPQSDLAQQITKDPYTFDFLMLGEDVRERELEQGLIAHLKNFLLELGVGFAFVASQYRVVVGESDFYLDLLFYHLKLRCFVVIDLLCGRPHNKSSATEDLKIGTFSHADAGQMNLYLNYAREHWTHPHENPPVGLILCSEKDSPVAHYALGNLQNQVLAREYELALPKEPELASRIEAARRTLPADPRDA